MPIPDRPRGYRLARAARSDIAAIWEYTFQNWSRAQANTYVQAIMAAIADLAAGKRAGRRSDVRAGFERYGVRSHVIWFRRGKDGIEVIRVLHQRQDVDRNLPG